MTLTAKRIEHLARELAARSDQAIRQAISEYDPESRLALKIAVTMARRSRGISAQTDDAPQGRRAGEQDGAYWVRQLGIDGPIDIRSLEAKLAAADVPTHVGVEVKSELADRQWLASGGFGYRAPARDDQPLSLEMAGLYRAAGLEPDGLYTPREVDEALAASSLAMHERMAIRTEMGARSQVSAAGSDAVDDWQTKVQMLNHRMAALRRLVRG